MLRPITREDVPIRGRRGYAADIIDEFLQSELEAAIYEDKVRDMTNVRNAVAFYAKRHGLPVKVSLNAGVLYLYRK